MKKIFLLFISRPVYGLLCSILNRLRQGLNSVTWDSKPSLFVSTSSSGLSEERSNSSNNNDSNNIRKLFIPQPLFQALFLCLLFQAFSMKEVLLLSPLGDGETEAQVGYTAESGLKSQWCSRPCQTWPWTHVHGCNFAMWIWQSLPYILNCPPSGDLFLWFCEKIRECPLSFLSSPVFSRASLCGKWAGSGLEFYVQAPVPSCQIPSSPWLSGSPSLRWEYYSPPNMASLSAMGEWCMWTDLANSRVQYKCNGINVMFSLVS